MTAAEPPHPTTWPATMAFVLPTVWNSETKVFRFRRMSCRDAGRQFMERAFVCRAEQLVLRSGVVRRYAFVVLADGTVTASRPE